MSRYEVFRDIARSLSSLLEKNLDKVGGKQPRVVVAPPRKDAFKSGDFPLVCIYLFDIREDLSNKDPKKVLVTEKDARGLTQNYYVNPPVFLLLSYIVTAWGNDTEEEQALLGQTIRIIEDHKILEEEKEELVGDSFLPEEVVDFQLADWMDLDRQVRFWNAVGESFRPSVTYVIRATIDSEIKTGPVTRVTERVADFKEKRKRRSV